MTTRLSSFWQNLRQRRAAARANAEIRKLARGDARVAQELRVLYDHSTQSK